MGFFGNKKQEQLDTSQDQRLTNLEKQLSDITKLCNTWFSFLNKTLIPQINALIKRVADGEKLDAQQQAAIDGLVSTAIKIQNAAKETSTES